MVGVGILAVEYIRETVRSPGKEERNIVDRRDCGWDFLIAYVLLILGHSLFEVVIALFCARFLWRWGPAWRDR